MNASSILSYMEETWSRESTETNSLRLTPAICAATSWLTRPTSYHFAAAAARNSVANSDDSRSKPAKVSSGSSISTRFITATLVTLIEDRKSNSGQHAGRARFVVPDAISFQGSGDHGDRTTIKFCVCSGTIKIFLEWGTFGGISILAVQ